MVIYLVYCKIYKQFAKKNTSKKRKQCISVIVYF